jgi:CRP-like cAMP-binding protein
VSIGTVHEHLSYDWVLLLVFSVVDAIFIVDTFSFFFTAKINHSTNRLITDPKYVAKEYVKGGVFIINIGGSIPYDIYALFLETKYGDHNVSFFVSLRELRFVRSILRLMRSMRIGTLLFRSWVFQYYGTLLRFVKSTFCVLLCLHWVCCLWVVLVTYDVSEEEVSLGSNSSSVGGTDDDGHYDENWTYLHDITGEDGLPIELHGAGTYLKCFYFTTLMFVLGDDIGATTVNQMTFCTFFQLMGIGVVAVIFGNVIVLIDNLNYTTTVYQNKLREISKTMQFTGLPLSLRKRVVRFYQYSWQEYGCFGGGDQRVKGFLDELSSPLRNEVQLFRHRRLCKLAMFRDCGSQVTMEILGLWQLRVYLPGDYIVTAGHIGHDFFIIGAGICDVITPAGKVVMQMKAGDHFGDRAMVMRQRRSMSIKAVTYCDCYSLSRSDFNTVRARYPDYDSSMREHLSKLTGETTTTRETLERFEEADILSASAQSKDTTHESKVVTRDTRVDSTFYNERDHQEGTDACADANLQGGQPKQVTPVGDGGVLRIQHQQVRRRRRLVCAYAKGKPYGQPRQVVFPAGGSPIMRGPHDLAGHDEDEMSLGDDEEELVEVVQHVSSQNLLGQQPE